MIEDDPDFFYDRPLNILMADEILNGNYIEFDRTMEFDIKFFPEGGNLVEGIPSRVAFKAMDETGRGITLKGIIVNESGKTVTDFISRHDGMGSFSHFPEPDRKYYAYVKYEMYEKVFSLPEAIPEGIVMHVNNLKDSTLLVLIKPSENYINSQITMLAITRGIVYLKQKVILNPEGTLVTIPKSLLPNGSCQLTLFDQHHLPLAERLVFVNEHRLPKVTILASSEKLKPRQPMAVDLSLQDPDGRPIENAVFSIAVTDCTHLNKKNEEESIISYLLLSSDLKTYLANSGYYFNHFSKEVKVHLDLVMLTHGWRRYTWKNVTDDNPGDQEKAQKTGFHIEGTAYKENTLDPLVNGTITFLSMDDHFPGIWMTSTNGTGQFSLRAGMFPESTKIISKSINRSGRRVNTDILFKKNEPYSSVQKEYQKFPIRIDKNINGYLAFCHQKAYEDSIYNFDETVLLSEIMVKGEKYFRTNYGKPDYRLEVTEEMANFQDIFQMMKGRIAGLRISGSGINTQVQIRGNSNFTVEKTPMFILDGVPLNNPIPESLTGGEGKAQIYAGGDLASMPLSITAVGSSIDRNSLNAILLSLQPSEIEKIDVLKTMGSSSNGFGYRGHNGVIVIYTKLGSGKLEKRRTLGYEEIRLPGYSLIKEFYHPDYSKENVDHIKPDHRITVYWHPLMTTDAKGRAEVKFYNSDNATRLQIEINGITRTGQPFHTLGTIGMK